MSLSPPPRKQSMLLPQRTPSSRHPKINTNALAAAHAPVGEDIDDQLANFLASTSLDSSSSISTSQNTHSTQGENSRPTSVASVYSPLDSSDASWSSRISPQSCLHGHHHPDSYSSTTQGHEQEMSMTGPMLSPCSYCSSVRSNSISSIMDDAHRLARDRNSSYQFFENQRRSTLKELIPSEVRHRLTFHLDECWFVHFSPSGEFLASAGLDHSIILWKDLMSPEPSVHMTLSFDRTVTQLGWSPDGQYLLVNHGYIPTNPDFSYQLRLIEVKTGETVFTRIQRKSTYTPIISDIAWFPDSQRFLAADDNGRYTIWNIHGDIVKEYTVPQEVASCYIKNIPGTENFVVSTVNNLLEFHSFEGGVHTTKKLGTLYQPTALSVSSKGRYVVVTERENDAMHRPANLIVYDLHSMTYLRSFEAQTFENKNFVIFPAFTGPNEEILSSGSENGKLHFWDIESGELIMVLEEHSKHSGCNSTSPVHPGMMASCSDDNHIIIWVTKELQNELQELDEKWFEKRRQLARPTIDIKKGW